MYRPLRTFFAWAVLAVLLLILARYLPVVAFIVQAMLLIPTVPLWLAEASGYMKRDLRYVLVTFVIVMLFTAPPVFIASPFASPVSHFVFGCITAFNIVPFLHIALLMLREGKIALPFGYIRVEFARTGNDTTTAFQYQQTLSRAVDVRSDNELPEHIREEVVNYRSKDRYGWKSKTLLLVRGDNRKTIGVASYYTE